MKLDLYISEANDYARDIRVPVLHPHVAIIHYDEAGEIRHTMNRIECYGIFLQREFPENLTYGIGTYHERPRVGATEGMAGANAVGAFALADSDNEEDVVLAREYVQRLWDVQPPTGKWRYYVGMVYFLSMLHVSGHFSIISSM